MALVGEHLDNIPYRETCSANGMSGVGEKNGISLKMWTKHHVLPTGYTTLLRRWINVNDVDSTSQQRRVPSGLPLLTVVPRLSHELWRYDQDCNLVTGSLAAIEAENVLNGRYPKTHTNGHPMLGKCWPSVADGGPILTQQWINV